MIDSDLVERCRAWVEEYSDGVEETQSPIISSNNYKPPISVSRQYHHNPSSTSRRPIRNNTLRNLVIVGLSIAGLFYIYTSVKSNYNGQPAKQEVQTRNSINFSPPELIDRDKHDQDEMRLARAEEAYEKSVAASDHWDDRTARHYITVARENDPDNVLYQIEEARLELRAEIARQAGKTLRGIRDLFR
ncbi:MAG: hypothetical protein KKC75_08355 [Nanoarchaeota archaeon]|nr:hypothetical protein [Nanoarchaeota archaeon]MBU1004483.1 hypothetical protein [Nanoarchaeota archaeon]MBU1945653.1 hypothetical protein [Nanoarchaeota archaeon]